MRIGHIAMYVNDLEAAREFFENYLGGLAGELYHNPETGFRSYFVRFDDSTQLELMNRPVMEDPEKGLRRTGYTHLAFSTGSIHEVDALTERLRAGGYRVLSGPRTTGDGYYESTVEVIEGNQIEITV